jgi:hypothetical protein
MVAPLLIKEIAPLSSEPVTTAMTSHVSVKPVIVSATAREVDVSLFEMAWVMMPGLQCLVA